MRALTETKILKLSIDDLMALVNKTSEYTRNDKNELEKKLWVRDFSTKVKLAYNRYLKAERSYPLDYLMKFPNKGTYEEEDIDRIQRKNLLKNVTLRIINDIRERKKRPSLKDLVYQYELRKD